MNNSIRHHSDVELLQELLRRNPPEQGPTRQTHASTIRQSIVGIGCDNLACIQLHTDDIDAIADQVIEEVGHGQPA